MSKKYVLIVDDSTSTIESLKIVLEKGTDFTPIVEIDYDKIIKNYTNDKYEYLIVEHNCVNSNQIINYICSKNPQQKVILLSDSINCPIDCATCLASLKFVRLLKPINFKTVLYYLTSSNTFECPNKYRFDSINTIEKLFDFINLEENRFYTRKSIENTQLIISSAQSGSMSIEELEKIKSNVNDRYFNLEILEEGIVITDKLKKIS